MSHQVGPARLALVGAIAVAGLCGCSARELPPLIAFPPPPAAPRIIYLGRLDEAPIDGRRRDALSAWLTDSPGFLQATPARPMGLAAHGSRLYVCDLTGGVVLVFDYEAQDAFALQGLSKPVAVAVAPEGTIYVADAGRGQIAEYGADLRRGTALPPPTPGFRPSALALADGRLYAADTHGGAIHVFDIAGGRWVATVGGGLRFPSGVGVSGGAVWCVDAADGRLLRAELNGGSFQPTSTSREFARPKQMTTDALGRLYITDALRGRLLCRDSRGRTFAEVIDAGVLPLPTGVCVSTELLRFYRSRLPKDFAASAVVFVSNQDGPPGVAVFAIAGE